MDDIFSATTDFLNQTKDVRYQPKVTYRLSAILFLVLCAQLCGYTTFRGYKIFGIAKKSFLTKFYPELKTCPSVKTITTIFGLIDPKKLDAIFSEAMGKIYNKEQAVLAIDGKAHRGVKDEDGNILTTVSVYNCDERMVISQAETANKGGELHTGIALVKSMHLNNQVITADSAYCYQEFIDTIIQGNANFAIALKGNQPKAFDLTVCAFEDCNQKISVYENTEKKITRKVSLIDLSKEQKRNWGHDFFKHINSLIKIDTKTATKTATKTETRYYVSNITKSPEFFAKTIRDHWGIENGLHWVLDVVFGEDARLIDNKIVAKNESTIRRIALNAIKKTQEIVAKHLGVKKVALVHIKNVLMSNDNLLAKVLSSLFAPH